MRAGASEPGKGFQPGWKSVFLLITPRATRAPFHQDPQRSLAEFASELPTWMIEEDCIYPHLLPTGQGHWLPCMPRLLICGYWAGSHRHLCSDQKSLGKKREMRDAVEGRYCQVTPVSLLSFREKRAERMWSWEQQVQYRWENTFKIPWESLGQEQKKKKMWENFHIYFTGWVLIFLHKSISHY